MKTRTERLPQIGTLLALWLVFVHLWMDANCEGFLAFLLLFAGGAVVLGIAVLCAVTRVIRLPTLVFFVLGMASTLPGSFVGYAIEGYFAEKNLAVITVALERYRADHGRYPDALSALRPRYLAEIPFSFHLLQRRKPYFLASRSHYYASSGLVCSPSVGDSKAVLDERDADATRVLDRAD